MIDAFVAAAEAASPRRDRGRPRRDPRVGLLRGDHRRRVAAGRCGARRLVGRWSAERGRRARSERGSRPTSRCGVPGGRRGQPDEGARRAAAGVAPRARRARLRCRAPPARSRRHVPRLRRAGRRVGGRRAPHEGARGRRRASSRKPTGARPPPSSTRSERYRSRRSRSVVPRRPADREAAGRRRPRTTSSSFRHAWSTHPPRSPRPSAADPGRRRSRTDLRRQAINPTARIRSARHRHDDVPQSPPVGRPEARRRNAIERPRTSVEEQLSGSGSRCRRRREPDDRVDALRGRPEQRPHHPVEPRERLGQPGRVRPARMHGAERDTGRREPPRPFAHRASTWARLARA